MVKKDWTDKKIAVIGDVMLDKYIFGTVQRISPEAPIPIVEVNKESYVPGGAANAAANVASLQGNALLIGIVGQDAGKEILFELLKERGITAECTTDPSRPTIQKTRVIAQGQQLLRIDREDCSYHTTHLEIPEADAIIVSDYAKGTITEKGMDAIIEKNMRVFVDPKPKHKSWYKGCFLITPNKKEAEEMVHHKIESNEDIEKAGEALGKELDCHVLLTLGEKGMVLFEKGKSPVHLPTVAKEVRGKTG